MAIYTERGKVYKIFDHVRISEKFSKREIVFEVKTTNERGTFIDYIKMQAINERCIEIDNLNKGDIVQIRWQLAGRKYKKQGQEERFFTNVELIDVVVISTAAGTGRDDSIIDQLPMGEREQEYDPLADPVQSDVIADPDQEEEEDDLPF